MRPGGRNARRAAAVFAVMLAGSASAQEACGLCDKAVVLTPDLAQCFLDNYAGFADKDNPVVIVDLSICPGSRDVITSVVPALPTMSGEVAEPDTMMMLTKAQLTCLKTALEQPGLDLDPYAKIELESCQ